MSGLSRRELLAGMGALAVTPHVSWKQEKLVGWAVLGLGSYAQYQVMPQFANSKNSKLVALISGTPEKLQRYGEQYGIAEKHRYSYETMDSIKDNPEIEVVYVVTPPATHPDFAIRAARAGKHVCSEKPMAPTVAECQRMIDEVKKAGKLLQVGYRSHYEACNMRAIEIVRSGELGKIKTLRSDHGFDIGPGQWRLVKSLAGGGSMMDIGIYSMQALMYLSGEEPIEVKATIKNPPGDDRFKEVEDEVDFYLTMPSGLVAHGTSGYSWRPGKNRYDIEGEKHVLMGYPATSYAGNKLMLDGMDQKVPLNNQFQAQIEHFSDCIRSNKPVKTPGEMGLRDIKIIQAIYESAATGKSVKLG
jgi:predicted dehydrogenase